MNSAIVGEGVLEGLREIYLHWYVQRRELLEDERKPGGDDDPDDQ
jgi:hypothetical protein